VIPETVMVLNRNRQIVFSNRTFVELLGAENVAEICGLRPGEALQCKHASETPGGCGTTEYCTTCGAVQSILASQQGEVNAKECRIVQKNTGEALDLKVWSSPFSSGDEPFTIHAVTDISHQKRRNALERIFFHDVLNTAGGLLGMAEILKGSTAEEAKEFVGDIYTISQRLIREIQAQRELSAAESNELKTHPVPVDARELLEEIVDTYRAHEAARGKEIRVEPGTPETAFTSDRNLLHRVISNLLKNALEASDPGDRVTLGCASDNGEVSFRVHNPRAMPREVQLQVFQRSFSTKGAGRGLGTYSIRLLSERYLKGQVSFRSSEPGGTTFTACYPLTLELDVN
jgi:signal transduction histidine kinase